ncbi:MAG: hypothetical protein KJS97_01510 [Alphaproteobacteria bacterium]|nr:hypothetical protein [Alphaproteobacteria bacterium]
MTSLVLAYAFLFLIAGAVGFGAGYGLRRAAMRARDRVVEADIAAYSRRLDELRARMARD